MRTIKRDEKYTWNWRNDSVESTNFRNTKTWRNQTRYFPRQITSVVWHSTGHLVTEGVNKYLQCWQCGKNDHKHTTLLQNPHMHWAKNIYAHKEEYHTTRGHGCTKRWIIAPLRFIFCPTISPWTEFNGRNEPTSMAKIGEQLQPKLSQNKFTTKVVTKEKHEGRVTWEMLTKTPTYPSDVHHQATWTGGRTATWRKCDT